MAPFQPGTIVWAKFERHPYWPARIASTEVTTQLREHKGYSGLGVLFFGETLTYALVPETNIKAFDKHLKQYAKETTAGFAKALEMAVNKHEFEDPPLVIKHRRSAEKAKKAKRRESCHENGKAGEVQESSSESISDAMEHTAKDGLMEEASKKDGETRENGARTANEKARKRPVEKEAGPAAESSTKDEANNDSMEKAYTEIACSANRQAEKNAKEPESTGENPVDENDNHQ